MKKKEDYSKYYEIIRTIGESGPCDIFEVKNKKTQEKKALKVMEFDRVKQKIREEGEEPTEKKMSPYIECFYNEAKYMHILQGQNNYNENAVLLDDFFENKNEMAILMELCDTHLFDHLSDKENDLNSEEIYDILNQLNNSFEIMNKNKILHRALRLENILIKYKNKEKDEFIVKLKLTNDCCLKELSNKLIPEKIAENCKIYAPEVLNKGEYAEESDLWSLGILIYLLCFKEYPFKGQNKEEVLSSIQNINLTGLRKTNDDNLNDLIKGLLILEPQKRLTWEQYFKHSFFINNPLNDYQKYYEIKETIGQGAYGIVKKAKNKISGEEVAIKIIDKHILKNYNDFSYLPSEEIINTSNITKELKDEVNFMKILEGKNKENKNTVKVYEYFNMEKEFIIVMELCDGNLRQYLKKRKNAFNSSEIYDLLSQLNNTFRIMYENKILHRDFKLENILYKTENNKTTFKLTDYGGAKQIIKTLETISTRIGTIPYMPPEMIDGEKLSLGKTDLWSLGIIIYVLCFRVFPYQGENSLALINQIRSLGTNSLKKTNDLYLDNLIRKLLVEKVRDRISWEDYFNHDFFKKKK